MARGPRILSCLLLILGSGSAIVVDLTEYTPQEFSLELQNHESIFVKVGPAALAACLTLSPSFSPAFFPCLRLR